VPVAERDRKATTTPSRGEATGGHRPSMSVVNHHTEEVNGPRAGTPTISTSRTPSDVQNAAAVATPLTVRQKAKERPCHPRAH
jgi:hypothetical protein